MEEKEIVLKRAKNAVISRDFSLALRIYNSLLKYDSENIEYLRSVGSIYEKTGDDQKALEYYARILRTSKSDFNALNSIGGIYRRLKNYDKAIMVLEKALQTGENNALVNYNLGFTYKLTGEYQKAIDCFESVIDENPGDVLAYNHLGAIYYQKGDYNKSILTYKRGLQVDSNHPILQYNLAKSYEAISDDQNAIIAYETSLRGKPGWLDAVRDYSSLLLRQHKSKQAMEIVKNAEEIHSEKDDFLYLKGKIYFDQFNFEMAQEIFEKLTLSGKNDFDTLLELAKVYEAQGNYEDAVETLFQAEESCPEKEKEDFEKSAVSILISAGRSEEAWTRLEKLLKRQKSPLLLDLEGQFYISQGITERLEKIERQIQELKPNFYRYLTDWGLSFHKNGQTEEAKKCFKAHIERNRKCLKSWLYLALIEEKEGNRDAAILEYKNALKIDPSNFIAQKRLNELSRGLLNSDDFSLPEEALITSSGIIGKKSSLPEDSSDEFEKKNQESDSSENSENQAATQSGENNENSRDSENENQADSDDSDDKENEEVSLSDMEMEESNILDIETEEIKGDNFDFDGENKSLSQELLEGEELSDFGYEMPLEEEEEEEENEKSPEIIIDENGENKPDNSYNEDQTNSKDQTPSTDQTEQDEKSSSEDSEDNFAGSDDDYRQEEDDYSDNLADDNLADKREEDYPKKSPEKRDERRDEKREPAYQDPYRDINPQELREMTEKLEMAQESAMKAMKAAEKAWDAAQKAADSASAVENAGDYINQLTEDAARKLQDVSDDLKSEMEKGAESGENGVQQNESLSEDNVNQEEKLEAERLAEENAGQKELLEEETLPEEGKASNSDDALSIQKRQQSQDEGSSEIPEGEILSEGEVNEVSDAFTGDGESETLDENELADVLSMCSPEDSAEEMTSEDISAENQSYEKVLGEVSKLLPYIENILQNKEDAKRFKQEVSLFNQLKEMGALLPEDKRRNFMTSRIRITLDFLIARLSGKPGLLKTTASLRQSGVLAEEEKNPSEEVQLSNLNLVKKVIGDMKILTQDLGDRELAEGLVKMAEKTEEKLFKTE
ncbi:MAG: tetratricopeptide repeat protein [Treponema sp.]|nr:tetratricopeptide repeat protein [Treponema sp.]